MNSAELKNFTNFKPAGPVAAAYLADRTSLVKTIRGPIGSGKTVVNVFDGLMAASHSMPVCLDGQIHFRDAIIGLTYGQLERNLYHTWKGWLPECPAWTPGNWSGGGGRFATHSIRFKVNRNGRAVIVNYEAIFAAIGEMSLEQFMRGFEPSAWYLFEVDQLPAQVIEGSLGRLGRWPRSNMLPPGVRWDGYVRACLNPPDIDSWYYHLAEEVRPKGFKAYVQPSGLSPAAENMHNLRDPEYYTKRAEMNKHKPRWVKRFVKNEYGPSDDGEPVYKDHYADETHLSAQRIPCDPERPVYLGFDQGLTQPACIIAQRGANGQWRILAEVVPGRMNGQRFGELVKRVLADRCPNCVIEGAWADPAGFSGADKVANEFAWAETVSHVLGVHIWPAPTNEVDPRLTAVMQELEFSVAPGVPALILSRGDTPILRKGFVSDYCYRRERVGNTDRFSDKPDKSRVASNPHDALQYLLLGAKGRYGVVLGRQPKGAAQAPRGGCTIVKSDFLS